MVRSFEAETRALTVGTRAFQQTITSATIVDDFNDESLSEYSESGTDEYGFETTGTIEGAANLTRIGTGGYHEIVSTSGLANYPSKGSVFQAKIRCPLDSGSSGNSQVGPIFGAADLTNWYSARFDAVQDDFAIFLTDGGSQSSLVATNDLGGFYTAGDILVVEVTWDDGSLGGSDNDITARLMSSDKNTTHDTLSTNDSTHATESGVGCESYNDTDGDEPDMDMYEII